jgi:hypothetical protein
MLTLTQGSEFDRRHSRILLAGRWPEHQGSAGTAAETGANVPELIIFGAPQPYVDLSRGDASPETSVLLNYAGKSRFLVWYRVRRPRWRFCHIPSIIFAEAWALVSKQTYKNKHFLALLSNTICLVALVIGPLASAYFYLDVPPESFASKLNNVTSLDTLGLQDFGTLVNFDSSAGFMYVYLFVRLSFSDHSSAMPQVGRSDLWNHAARLYPLHAKRIMDV